MTKGRETSGEGGGRGEISLKARTSAVFCMVTKWETSSVTPFPFYNLSPLPRAPGRTQRERSGIALGYPLGTPSLLI